MWIPEGLAAQFALDWPVPGSRVVSPASFGENRSGVLAGTALTVPVVRTHRAFPAGWVLPGSFMPLAPYLATRGTVAREPEPERQQTELHRRD